MPALTSSLKALKHACLLSLVLGAPASIAKSTTPAEKVDYSALTQYLNNLAANDKAMGAVSIMVGDEIVYHHHMGFKDVKSKALNDAKTYFQIGSITKTYAAVMVMQLIEEGALSLETPLATFFPELPKANDITIAHLLSHTSGLLNFTSTAAYPTYMNKAHSQAELITLFKNQPMSFEPGSQYGYSNTNYVLLSFIIEKLDKRTFADSLSARITKPLNLKSTKIGDGDYDGVEDAIGYGYQDNWYAMGTTHPSVPRAAGAISATTQDVARFIDALFSTESLLKAESRDSMMRQGQYGFGVMSFPFYDKVAYGHNGGIDGFASNAAHIPADDVTISVSLNGVNTPFNDVLIAILSNHYQKPWQAPDFSAKPVALSTKALSRFEGQFTSKDLPLAIKVFLEHGVLKAQATGQGAFALTPFGERDFRFEAGGIRLAFDESATAFVLHQNGMRFNYEKQ